MTKRKPTVERRRPKAADSTGNARVREQRRLRLEARAHVQRAFAAMLEGTSGAYRTEVCNAILFIGAEVCARVLGAAETCSSLGANAYRVGEQLPVPQARAAAEAVFQRGAVG
jgi:hypothetical protein